MIVQLIIYLTYYINPFFMLIKTAKKDFDKDKPYLINIDGYIPYKYP